MDTKRTYSFEYNGKTYTRNTKRTYTHAIVYEFPNGHCRVSFAGSLLLAEKAHAAELAWTAKCTHNYKNTAIIELATNL